MEYIPGQCNIGKKEIKLRLYSAIFSSAIAITLFVFLILTNSERILRALLFPFILMASLNFLQVRFKFCAQYGLLGVFNFSDKIGSTDKIKNELVKIDRIKALKILSLSFAISLFVQLILSIV